MANVGDGLMADQGFLIDKEVEEIGLKLNILNIPVMSVSPVQSGQSGSGSSLGLAAAGLWTQASVFTE